MVQMEELNIKGTGAMGTMLVAPGGEGHPNMIVVQCKKGYLMCGYLNLAAAEKFGDAAVLVGGADFAASYTDTFTNWETTNADAIASINPDAGGLMDLSNDEFAALQAATTVPSEIVGEYNVEQLLDGRGGMDGMM